MIKALVIEAATGDELFPLERCPLIIGGSSRSAVKLPGAGPADEWLLIDFSANQPFVQPVSTAVAIQHNGQPLTESQWLRDGDSLRIADSEWLCVVGNDRLRLTRGQVPETGDTLPPLASQPPGEDDRIVPQSFARPGMRAASQRRRLRVAPLFVFTLLALLGVLAWYTFTARSVLVEVEPNTEELTVEGALLPVRLGDRFLLRPGEYTVRARLDGYYPLEAALEVTAERDQSALFQMQKLPGLVSFSTPGVATAQLLINEEPVGETPLVDLEVPAGNNAVAITAPRYLDFQTELEVLGMGKRQDLEVDLVPGWADVSLSSKPVGAQLSVDGSQVGPTPQTVELMAGEHKLRLQMAGHDDWTGRVVARADEPLDLGSITLQKSRAKLALTSQPEGALVQVDGVYRGRTPVELLLDPDQAHELLITRNGYQPLQQTLELASGANEQLELELKVILGTVRIVAEPADAELWVDGVARGKATQRLRLSARTHRIEIRKAGYQPYQTTVTPKPGLEQEIVVRLQKLGSGRSTSSSKRSSATTQAPDGQRLVYVGPGRFTMGSSRREQGRRSNESLREIELTRPFYIGAREISNAQFRRFEPSHRSGAQAGQSLDLEAQPVVNISWDQAARYCNWLSDKESLTPAYRSQGGRMISVMPPARGYRLPTEVEWVWAARGGQGERATRYPWGDAWPPPARTGNFADRSVASVLPGAMQSYDDGHMVTAPVGTFASGSTGLMDMAGNVAEWVQDIYSIYPPAGARQRDPLGPTSGGHHVIRGSSWRDGSISELRLSYRDYGNKGRDDVGFRVARYAD